MRENMQIQNLPNTAKKLEELLIPCRDGHGVFYSAIPNLKILDASVEASNVPKDKHFYAGRASSFDNLGVEYLLSVQVCHAGAQSLILSDIFAHRMANSGYASTKKVLSSVQLAGEGKMSYKELVKTLATYMND